MSSLVAMIFLSMSQLAMSCCSEDYVRTTNLPDLVWRYGVQISV